MFTSFAVEYSNIKQVNKLHTSIFIDGLRAQENNWEMP